MRGTKVAASLFPCFFFLSSSFFFFFPIGKIALGFPGASVVKNPPAKGGDSGLISGSGKSLETEMATQSSILAWEIPWTEEPGQLQSRGSLKELDGV